MPKRRWIAFIALTIGCGLVAAMAGRFAAHLPREGNHEGVSAGAGTNASRLAESVCVPLSSSADEVLPLPPVLPKDERDRSVVVTYTVVSGDTYGDIAKRLLGTATLAGELEEMNRIPAEKLLPGTVIRLPRVAGGFPRSYTVREGDTLAAIAETAYGSEGAWGRIAEANRVSPESLTPGMELILPAPRE